VIVLSVPRDHYCLFLQKQIRSDESQDRCKVNNEENVSNTNDISAPVLNSNNFEDLQNVVDNNVQKYIFFDVLYIYW